jgi:hypothetical protein
MIGERYLFGGKAFLEEGGGLLHRGGSCKKIRTRTFHRIASTGDRAEQENSAFDQLHPQTIQNKQGVKSVDDRWGTSSL